MSDLVEVINSGSSSIKYQLIELSEDSRPVVWATGLVERIGEAEGHLTHRTRIGASSDAELRTWEMNEPIPTHAAGFEAIERAFAATGEVANVGPLRAFGHRVVHGGDIFAAPALVDDEVIAAIEACIPLAPLHNPANLAGIRGAMAAQPDVPNVAVFDTAFHQTMPRPAYTYALNAEVARTYRIRRYGFHGTSHAYVSRTATRFLGLDPESARVVTLHLGNGASACAVKGGRSIDTSMGMTPLAGLVMGTRSGDIDPAIALHLQNVAGMSALEADALLNKDSGLKGLCGDNDLRQVHARAQSGDDSAALALYVYAYRVRGYLGAYAAALGGLDAVVFTAGVGENDAAMRAQVCSGLEWLGLHLDAALNTSGSGIRRISTEDSPVAVLVVPTDEESEIARQTLALLSTGRAHLTRAPDTRTCAG